LFLLLLLLRAPTALKLFIKFFLFTLFVLFASLCAFFSSIFANVLGTHIVAAALSLSLYISLYLPFFLTTSVRASLLRRLAAIVFMVVICAWYYAFNFVQICVSALACNQVTANCSVLLTAKYCGKVASKRVSNLYRTKDMPGLREDEFLTLALIKEIEVA